MSVCATWRRIQEENMLCDQIIHISYGTCIETRYMYMRFLKYVKDTVCPQLFQFETYLFSSVLCLSQRAKGPLLWICRPGINCLWIVSHFCCRCWICQLWHLVSLLSTFLLSWLSVCQLQFNKRRNLVARNEKRSKKWTEVCVMLSQVCGRCSGGFGQQWVAFKGRLSYLTPPLLIWVTLRDGRSEETAATRRCKATSLIFLNVSEKCSYRGCSNTLFYRSNGFLTFPEIKYNLKISVLYISKHWYTV